MWLYVNVKYFRRRKFVFRNIAVKDKPKNALDSYFV
jgi:hypothetical protein